MKQMWQIEIGFGMLFLTFCLGGIQLFALITSGIGMPECIITNENFNFYLANILLVTLSGGIFLFSSRELRMRLLIVILALLIITDILILSSVPSMNERLWLLLPTAIWQLVLLLGVLRIKLKPELI